MASSPIRSRSCSTLRAGEHGTLRCHVARANPQWKALQAERRLPRRVPGRGRTTSRRPGTRRSGRHGKVVPTWNYATVHCWGRAVIHDDPAWVRDQIEALTRAARGTAAARRGRSRTRRSRFHRSADARHRRHSKSRSRASKANGRSARTAPRRIASASAGLRAETDPKASRWPISSALTCHSNSTMK